ncbi:MAG: hypothetical protein NTZ35_04045 [Ignavibacteriales bacterium]|nr:hypothetical protein [Ignavibacteriales bacterium]
MLSKQHCRLLVLFGMLWVWNSESHYVFAQSASNSASPTTSGNNPNTNDLRTPASPAFVLLGIEPSSVERPSTPRALAASLLSASGQNDILPRNYAFEFSPYWFSSHSQLTFDKYYHADMLQSLAQTLSVSFVTSRQTGGDTTAQGTDVGFGLRAQLVSGGPSDTLASLRRRLADLHERRGDLRHKGDTTGARLMLDSISAVAKQIAEEDHNRTGWIVEFAGAAIQRFPQNRFGEESLRRFGIWLTPSYTSENPKIQFLGVVRFLHDLDNVGNRDLLDAGFRFVYNSGRLSISSEYVSRSSLDVTVNPGVAEPAKGNFSIKNTYRLSANVEYKYSDDMYLSMSLGRNYQGVAGQGNLIAQVSVNFGFGETKLPVGNE